MILEIKSDSFIAKVVELLAIKRRILIILRCNNDKSSAFVPAVDADFCDP